MFKLRYCIGFLLLLFFQIGYGQEEFPYNGVIHEEYNKYLLHNAIIHIDAENSLEGADLLIEDGKIIGVGKNLEQSDDAIVVDLLGTHNIYAGFIDLFSDYGMPDIKKSNGSKKPQFLSDKPGAYSWNEAIKSEFRSSEHFTLEEKKREKLLACGIMTTLSLQKDGLSRGSASLVLLTEKDHKALLEKDCAHAMSFKKGSSSQDYPGSLMGAIALLKQTHYDAEWNEKSEGQNISLERWSELSGKPLIFETGNKWEALNAIDIAETMSAEVFLLGNNDEYQRIEELKAKSAKFILPVNFPRPSKIETSFDLMHSQYRDMKHWELASYNARMLYESKIPFCFTADESKDAAAFRKNLRKLYKNGLPKEEILRALTTRPAQWMGVEDQLASLEKGKRANFFITDGDFLESNASIKVHFIDGKPNKHHLNFSNPLEGKYEFVIGEETRELILKKKQKSWVWKSESDSNWVVPIKTGTTQWIFDLPWPDSTNMIECLGNWKADVRSLSGMAYGQNDLLTTWDARLKSQDEVKNKKKTEKLESEFDPFDQIIFPFQAYGRKERMPEASNLLIKNATVWTNEEEGIIQADVWIKDGKIKNVGSNLDVGEAEVLDASGKHLTSGIIDEHSHIAIRRGVNEGTQSSSAEVSIADVINPEDINIYRHLGGGVTAIQQLHGSANPIGGQSSLIKLRWGLEAEEMKIKNADGFIKFALGENVKQTNWGDHQKVRYPQTRMGVEQIFVDYFTKALEYEEKKKSGSPYRYDLEMEALSEILNKERFISCHSYQQGEINMLMKVAERFDFRINTFTHILEGYKVADKMKEHGVGASTFSDWWAYKYEVIDAIPYNAAILHDMGVVTAINSDDAEMGRRLNQEAAKVMKYGDISEEDAWKMVTLNPAKLLHLDDRMGSIKIGKDADIVLWSENPLSSYSQVEQTYVDGVKYFDIDELKAMNEQIAAEKKRIAEKMQKDGSDKKPVVQKVEKHYHCDDIADELK